jgi:hypothetical protein
MKTLKIITALLFSVALGMVFSSVTGAHPMVVIPLTFAGIYIGSKYAPAGVLGLDLMDMSFGAPVDNMGGVQAIGYVALSDDIDTWPTIPDTDDTAMDIVQILSGTLTMNAGKYFFPFKMEVDKCSVESADVGVKGGLSQKHTLKFYRGDMAAKIRGFVRATNNQELVFVVPDAQGRMNFIGSAAYPARKLPEGSATTGEGPEGESAVTMTFCSYGNGPVPILPDTITIPIPAES